MKKELKTLPGQPGDHEGPVFREPWEASAFAIVVKLSEAGHFTWPEWVECLSTEIKKFETRHHHEHDHDHIHGHEGGAGIEYYHQWFAAMEKMLAIKNILDLQALDARYQHLKDHPVPHDHVARRELVRVA